MEVILLQSYTRVNMRNMDVADVLDKAMKRYKTGPISQAELSRLSGVPQPTISRTLKKTTTPDTETLRKLAKTLGIHFGELVDGQNKAGQERAAFEVASNSQLPADLVRLALRIGALDKQYRKAIEDAITEKEELQAFRNGSVSHKAKRA